MYRSKERKEEQGKTDERRSLYRSCHHGTEALKLKKRRKEKELKCTDVVEPVPTPSNEEAKEKRCTEEPTEAKTTAPKP